MDLRDLKLDRSYTQGAIGKQPVKDFLIPCLENSIEFNIITGYFSSKLLEKIFSILKVFLNNGGKIKILSGWLYEEDIKILEKNQQDLKQYFFDNFNKIISEFEELEKFNHLDILAWLILNKKLEVKFGTPLDYRGRPLILKNYILHEKIGYFKDKYGNYISFSGSANITVPAWFYNREQFKVFNSWEDITKIYCEIDIRKFSNYWNKKDPRLYVADISKLPEQILNKLIKYKKENLSDIDFPEPVDDSLIEEEPDLIKFIDSWLSYENSLMAFIATDNFWDCQIDGIEYLENKDFCGILSMATGTGKTRAAIRAAYELFLKVPRLLIIITVPDLYLVAQWYEKVIRYVDPYNVIQISSDLSYSVRTLKEKAYNLARDIKTRICKLGIIIGTNDSLNFEFYKDLTNEINENSILFISDECHTLGAPITRYNLHRFYPKYRIGLSATPIRKYDEIGTNFINSYFLDTEYFKYPIKKAQLEGYLMKFKYYVYLADVSDEDLGEFGKLTQEASYGDNEDIKITLKQTLSLILRANILKKNKLKISICRQILEEELIKKNKLKKIVIYCYNKSDRNIESGIIDDRSQITFLREEAINPLRKRYKNYFNFAIFDGSKSRRERLEIISQFNEKDNLVLIAIKCLDQGVDVPSLERAILLSSSGSNLEHIQRTGRLLRKNEEKLKRIDYVEIYDILSLPSKQQYSENPAICESIINYEYSRALFFIENSLNMGKNLIIPGFEQTKSLEEFVEELRETEINL